MLLKTKTALITGCNRGIGKAILEVFAQNGANIFAHARTQTDEFETLCQELAQKHTVEIVPVYFDMMDNKGMNNCFIQIKKSGKQLDILVNNAGIMKDAIIGMITNEMMVEQFTVNVFAVINMIQLATKFMIRQKSGCIVNITSFVGEEGSSGQVAYSATKGAVASLTKSCAKELCNKGIRVNAVSPGMISTELLQNIRPEDILNNVDKIGMGRMGQAEEIANAVLFLSSELSTYITGQIVNVNGGRL